MRSWISITLFAVLFVPATLVGPRAHGHLIQLHELAPHYEDPGEITIIEGNWDEPTPTPAPRLRGPSQPTAAMSSSVSGTNSVSTPEAATPVAPHTVTPDDSAAVKVIPPLWWTLRTYVVIGFEHILPMGVDHILFIFGLFLLSSSLRSILLQVSLFTLAHSLTLIFSSLRWVTLPGEVVEPLIAASIVFVAVESLFKTKPNRFHLFVVFLFGLLHGMGFAGALAEVGLPEEQFFPALISFNVGVELGQVTVVLLAYAALHHFQSKSWYRARVLLPISSLIATVGMYWTVTRIFF